MHTNKNFIYLPDLEEIIDRNPLIVTEETHLREIISLMSQNRNSCPLPLTSLELLTPQNTNLKTQTNKTCVLILDNQNKNFSDSLPHITNLKGIFTRLDLVRLIATHSSKLNDLTIGEVMTRPVFSIRDNQAQDLFTILLLLRQQKIRHLPITNSNGILLGVVTPATIRQAMLQPANLLKMRVAQEVMNHIVIQAPLHSNALQLAQQMNQHQVSCIIINDHNQSPVGVVTEGDIIQFQSLQLDLSKISAQTVMSSPLFSLNPQDSLWKAYEKMQSKRVRRLVVLGAAGELKGIITQSSLLKVLDPMEMSGIIDTLQILIEQRTGELQTALINLNQVIKQLETEITTRQETEQSLLLLESVVLNANDAIVVMKPSPTQKTNPTILFVNQAFTKLTGYSSAEIIGKTPTLLRGLASDQNQVLKIQQAFLTEQPVRLEIINYRKDGSQYWVELNTVPVRDQTGTLTHWISVQRDITDRKRMEQELFAEKELAQVTLQAIGDGVITTDATGHITSLNPIAEKLTGWTAAAAKGLPLHEVFRIVNEISGLPVENILSTAFSQNQILDLANQNLLIARCGHQFAIDHSAAPIHSSNGEMSGAVVVFRDITQIRTQARQLCWQASHDSLTGLVNRREFEYQLQQAFIKAQSQQQEHILLYLDLDRFKIVNDTSGHIAGDELLRQISEVFKTKIRKTDLLARLGGDEFAIILFQCTIPQGSAIAEKILATLQKFRFIWQDKTFTIGVSIGLVSINPHSQSTEQLLAAADAACYQAKDQGRNRLHIYQMSEQEVAKQSASTQWFFKITCALEENLFCLYYQPIVTITNPKKSGHFWEIFIRLQEPQTGQIISPMAFIPVAERYHLMHAIDRWVINNLLSQLSLLNLDDIPLLLSINLSADSLNDPEFISFLEHQLLTYKVSPKMLCFEMTETLVITNLTKASRLIERLKEMGCYLAMDNFGTGISAFSYLKKLPIDFIKIDGNLIKNILNNSLDLAIVEGINRISKVMQITTVAEFVENQALLKKVKEIGIDYAQGYGLCYPQLFDTKNPLHFPETYPLDTDMKQEFLEKVTN